MRALVASLSLSLAAIFGWPCHPASAADPAPRTITWSELEPVVRATLAAASSDAEEPKGEWAESVGAAVERTLPRVGLEADAAFQASPAGSLAGLLERPRAARLIRAAVADVLREDGINCTDCRLPAPPPRDVTFADVLPYVQSAVYVGADDLQTPIEHPAFHACVGGIVNAMLPDDELGEVALAATFASLEDEAVLARFKERVIEARRAHPKADQGVVTALLRGFVATDPILVAALRKSVAAEAEVAGLRFRDCGGPAGD